MELRDFFEGTTYEDVKIGGIMSTEKHSFLYSFFFEGNHWRVHSFL